MLVVLGLDIYTQVLDCVFVARVVLSGPCLRSRAASSFLCALDKVGSAALGGFSWLLCRRPSHMLGPWALGICGCCHQWSSGVDSLESCSRLALSVAPFCRAGGMRGVMVPVLACCMDAVQPAVGSQVASSAWRLGCLELGACVCSLGRNGLVVYLSPTFPFLLWAYSSGLPCGW